MIWTRQSLLVMLLELWEEIIDLFISVFWSQEPYGTLGVLRKSGATGFPHWRREEGFFAFWSDFAILADLKLFLTCPEDSEL